MDRSIERLAPIALTAVAWALSGCVGSPELVLDGGLYAPRLDGALALSNTTLTSLDEVDLDTDLDLGDSDAGPFARAEIDLGGIDLTAWGFATSASGDGKVTADFGNISSGSQVTSELDLTLAQGRVLFDVLERGGFELGAGLAAQWIDTSLAVTETTFGLAESVDLAQAVPLLAARAGFDLGKLGLLPLAIELSAAGIQASFADIEGTILDLEALARLDFGTLGLFAGWRYLLIEIDGMSSGQDFAGDVTLEGFVAGLTLRF